MKADRNHNNPDGSGQMQLLLAGAVTLGGIGMVIAGFIVSPLGEIHSSVLVAFGECLTFAGTLLGIDYRYKR